MSFNALGAGMRMYTSSLGSVGQDLGLAED
jgi:hypothetical protein